MSGGRFSRFLNTAIRVGGVYIIGANWFAVALTFYISLWSLQGEYLISAMAFVYLLFSLIDGIRNIGLRQMLISGPLGRNYFLFRVVTLIISAEVNLVVYLKLLLN